MPELFYGWLPDYPDFRDRSIDHTKPTDNFKDNLSEEKSISYLRSKAKVHELKDIGSAKTKLPSKTSEDLSKYFHPVDSQGDFNACTAHAATSLIEYFESRTYGDSEKKSRLFLYKVTRNLLGMTDDSGAFLRSTMKALVLFGVPPENYWKYEKANISKEPTPFCYSYAQNYQAVQYYRLDKPGNKLINNNEELLREVKINLVKGLPLMFGFTVYSNIHKAKDNGGMISYPTLRNSQLAGHAVVAIGYDDEIKIESEDGEFSLGAIRIRNSWGTDWGEKGYGWLPYSYVLKGLTRDWWSIIKTEWIDSKAFE